MFSGSLTSGGENSDGIEGTCPAAVPGEPSPLAQHPSPSICRDIAVAYKQLLKPAGMLPRPELVCDEVAWFLDALG